MFTRERLRTLLLVAGFIALFLALMPGTQYEGGITATHAQMQHLQANPQDMPIRNDIRLGWPSSPLFTYRSETALVERDGAITAKRTAGSTVGWVTWSSALLVIGAGLLWAAGRLKPKPQNDKSAA